MKKFIIMVLFLSGCTDAHKGSWGALGSKAEMVCYSGGKEIFRDKSTGRIEQLDGGGFHYKSINGAYVRTFADCFVEVK